MFRRVLEVKNEFNEISTAVKAIDTRKTRVTGIEMKHKTAIH